MNDLDNAMEQEKGDALTMRQFNNINEANQHVEIDKARRVREALLRGRERELFELGKRSAKKDIYDKLTEYKLHLRRAYYDKGEFMTGFNTAMRIVEETT